MRVTGVKTTLGDFACDLVVLCGPWVPDAGLVAQAGGSLAWDQAQRAFVPSELPLHVTAVGGVTGSGGWGPPAANNAPPAVSSASTDPGAFVCFCEDVMAKDVAQAVDEGFDHIETLKRYTTVTMGPCQGKMCQLASIGLCAAKTGRTIAETGVTTSRPPSAAVSLGALAGARHHPVKRTPMHAQHDALGCTWMDMGEWKRPLYYGAFDAAAKRRAVEAEYRGVRERAGLIDLSTLGKLDVKGADAPKLLDRVYTNRLSDLGIGRARYSVICDDAGIILDDGTISRLAGDHFFITTTTGNLEFVHQWLEWWAAGTGWCVHVTNVTGGYAAVNVAGPKARALLQPLTDCDLRTRAFPYMACRQAEVAGVPCILLRIGFVGETGWEIHFPAEYGEYLWDTLMAAGREHGIQPFGVETQRVLRLEKKHVIVGVDTDATSNPLGADMAWVAKLDKEDFIGKAAILQAQERALREKLVGFRMEDHLIPEDGAAILVGGEPLGRVTSARYSFANGTAVGLGWVPADRAADGQVIQVPVDGRLATGHVIAAAFYDPEGKRLRS
jgi:sarcosine oxidase, subunit alpha